ncbi:PREDICTED: 2-oxoglutarate-dependent dioxygenase AOP3-like [Nicotiana attenuata]|uniref:2-oxoglutarate-dependent dioxygenase aop1 n=1 Tax=Nicotiana attenuata TaxID=49451 RepID=A0A1J6JLW8_NICAT|nr:PREDICTED: 2-oxoglutarate-dependent dioxygenase AOP3-like [Nicotiana attenuata]OIT07889.1 putative 2-oxoglutarate-dependent dioxygenase aop1 [Nicotiana attenuata]
MASQVEPKLPIIEFTNENLSSGTSSWISTSQEIRRALEEYGCFAAVYKKVSPELREAMFNHCKELFQLPLETKLQNTSDVLGFGYGGNFPNMPLAEYFGIENGGTLDSTKNFAKQMWPNANVDKFCEETISYSKLIAELDDAVIQMILGSYGLEKYYEPLKNSYMYLMRFIKYRSPKMDEINIGHLPHRDKSFMGIIDTNQVGGLEMQTRDGNWMTFHPSPYKTVVFIAGEPFTAWSNGRVYAPMHRVIMKGTEDKYSLALFSFMRGTVKIPEELIDDENPQYFKSFDHFEYLKYCATDGWKEKNPIIAFCGV